MYLNMYVHVFISILILGTIIQYSDVYTVLVDKKLRIFNYS